MSARVLRPVLGALSLLLGACAFGEGEGFATVHPTVSARYVPDATRDAGEGWQRLASNFQVRLTRAQLELEGVALLASSGEGGAGAFDPGNPPPGYTICHSGHCDREDGALIPYEQVAAELGGGATVTTVASLPVEQEIDLLKGAMYTPACEPDCDLPPTRVTRADWDVHALVLAGEVRDAPGPSPRFPGVRSFTLALPAQGAAELTLSTELDLDSGRAEPPEVELGLELLLGARLLDRVAWERGVPDTGASAGVDLNAADNTALLQAVDVGLVDTRATVRREGR